MAPEEGGMNASTTNLRAGSFGLDLNPPLDVKRGAVASEARPLIDHLSFHLLRTERMPARLGQSEARLDLGEARLRVIPKIVSDVRGRYDIELTDRSGALLGRFNIAESGKQVDITQRPSKYEANLVYYHPERRLTAYAIGKPGSITTCSLRPATHSKPAPRLRVAFVTVEAADPPRVGV